MRVAKPSAQKNRLSAAFLVKRGERLLRSILLFRHKLLAAVQNQGLRRVHAIELTYNGMGTVLMIGGTDATAVEVGTRFLTDEASIASLHQALGVDLVHPLPHFEVLLSARELTDIPYNFEIVAYRVLHP